MATVRPFRALRPLPQFASQVASPPYDVINTEEARALAKDNPLSFLHISKPEIDMPAGSNPFAEEVYELGKNNLTKLISTGTLEQDEKPAFYIYTLSQGNHSQTGILGCVAAREYLNKTIRTHEQTQPDKELDRMHLIDRSSAHIGPIFLAYRSDDELERLMASTRPGSPYVEFTAEDGVAHSLWKISDDKHIQSLSQRFAAIPHLYVADGHHRAAASARVVQARASSNPNHTGEEDYNFVLALLFSHTQLRILPYNRIVRDLNGLTETQFLDALKKHFTVEITSAPITPSAKGQIGMLLGTRWYKLSGRDTIPTSNDVTQKLDVSILQNYVLSPILGIDDPRTNARISFVGGDRGVAELGRLVGAGKAAVAFSMFATSLTDLFDVADAGMNMPPKSTWFDPKPRDGLVVHTF